MGACQSQPDATAVDNIEKQQQEEQQLQGQGQEQQQPQIQSKNINNNSLKEEQPEQQQVEEEGKGKLEEKQNKQQSEIDEDQADRQKKNSVEVTDSNNNGDDKGEDTKRQKKQQQRQKKSDAHNKNDERNGDPTVTDNATSSSDALETGGEAEAQHVLDGDVGNSSTHSPPLDLPSLVQADLEDITERTDASVSASGEAELQPAKAPPPPPPTEPETKSKKDKSSKKKSKSKDKKSNKHDKGKKTSKSKQDAPKKSKTLPPPSLDQEVRFITNKFFDDVFEKGEMLGQATYSNIYSALHKASKKRYAIKEMNQNEMMMDVGSCSSPSELDISMNGSVATGGDSGKDSRNILQEEIDNLITCRNGPQIVPLLEIYQEGPNYYLVLEYMAGGELFDLILERDDFSEYESRTCCSCLLRALEYMHSKRVAHRDVKPENILLCEVPNPVSMANTKRQRQPINVKLADFGFSKKILSHNGCRTLCGTPGYMAPEILERWPSYDTPCDIWSVGVILFLLLGSYLPFEDEEDQSEDQVFERTRNGQYYFYPEYWSSISKSAKDIVTQMLTINPNKRITAEDALLHDWMQDKADGTKKDKTKKMPSTRQNSKSVARSLSRAQGRSESGNDRRRQLSQNFASYLERKGKEEQLNVDGTVTRTKGKGDGRTTSFNARSMGTNNGSFYVVDVVEDSRTGRPFQDFYDVGEMIGEGGYACVYEVEHRESKKIYAVKDVDLTMLDGGGDGENETLKDEIWALKVLRGGPHIVRLYDVFEEPEHVFLVMENMKGGDLLNRIGEKEVYTEREARKTCKVIFEAMDYIHKKKIAHRDIKPENVLLVEQGDDTTIKIADFGFAKKVPKPNCLRTLCGTAQYVAPEVLELTDSGYDQRADMWSVGVVTYILLGGYAPFEGPMESLAQCIIAADYEFHEQYWCEISMDAKDMISELLEPDPTKRLSSEEALRCTWMTLEEETLNVTDLSNAQQAIKKNKQEAEAGGGTADVPTKAVAKIASKHGSLGGKFTQGMGNFMDVKARKSCKSTMELGIELGVLEENSESIFEDSSSGKPFDILYKRGKALGEGTFSVTHKCVHKKSRVTYAVKRVTRKGLDAGDAVALQDEISALNLVADCDQIVALQDVFEEPDYTYLVYEYMGGGDLIERITQKESFTEADAQNVMKQLLLGVDYLHKHRISHRKLNPENILLKNYESDTEVKISDFGFAKKVLYPNCLRTQCGIEGYVAPEVLEHRPAYDVQCDMWTIGVNLYILLGGYRPFRGTTEEVMRQTRYGEYKFHKKYWHHVSAEAKHLITKMLTINPLLRITATGALKSEWIKMEPQRLGQIGLQDNLEELKKFRERAKAKLRAAVHSIIAAKKFQSLGQQYRAHIDF